MLNQLSSEKRRAARMGSSATALLLEGGTPIGQFGVRNLSASGALLSGGMEFRGSRPLRLLLKLDNPEPLRLGANLTRKAISLVDGVSVAVRFRHIDTNSEDVIQNEVLSTLVREWNRAHPAVLIIEEREEQRHRVAEELEGKGRRVHAVEDPSDALALLDDPQENIDTVILYEGQRSPLSYELVKARSRIDKKIKTLLLQGSFESESRDRSHRRGPRSWTERALRKHEG